MNNKNNIYSFALTTILSGISMWIVGGLYHNLILPSVNDNVHPHHEGLGITLLAYLLLGLLISYFYTNSKQQNDTIGKGLRIGVIVGILWVFPHGLTMAAVHETSFSYQFTNTLYHMVEQGIGGVIIFWIQNYFQKKSIRSN